MMNMAKQETVKTEIRFWERYSELMSTVKSHMQFLRITPMPEKAHSNLKFMHTDCETRGGFHLIPSQGNFSVVM